MRLVWGVRTGQGRQEDEVGVGSVDGAGKTGRSLGGQEQGEDSGWQEEGYPWPRGFGGGLAGRRCLDLLDSRGQLPSRLHQSSFVKPQSDTVPGAM